MDLVLDTNILFSALLGTKIKDTLAKALIAARIHTTRELIEEIEEHWIKILKHTYIPRELLNEFYATTITSIIIHQTEKIPAKIIGQAKRLTRNADPDDWPFVALAMFLGVPLWTGDKELLVLSVGTGFKHFVAVDTKGVEMLLEGKSLGEVEERMREKHGWVRGI